MSFSTCGMGKYQENLKTASNASPVSYFTGSRIMLTTNGIMANKASRGL